MFDLPLHPVIVHFPIVLGILLPFIAFFAWVGHPEKKVGPRKSGGRWSS